MRSLATRSTWAWIDRLATISMRSDNAPGMRGALRVLAALTCVVCLVAPSAFAQFRLFGGRDGRRVTLRASDGVTLSGEYYEPSKRPGPGIILLHMLKRTHADWENVGAQLSDAGFAVLALDF